MFTQFVALDVETIPDPEARAFLEELPPVVEEPDIDEPLPAANLRDPEKIAADIERRRAKLLADREARHAKKVADRERKCEEQLGRMSLDPFAGRLVCLGYQTEEMDSPVAFPILTPSGERDALRLVKTLIAPTPHRSSQLIGFRVQSFDWPFLVTRGRLLGVELPPLDTRKYGNRDITDLWSLLTFDGSLPEGAFPRRLKTLARRFGLEVTDDTSGADVAVLAEGGGWDAIVSHCESDVALTVALARRLGVIAPVREPVLDEATIPF